MSKSRPRTLVFSMQHHLEVLYKVFSNYAHMVKRGPARGAHLFHIE